MTCVKFFCKHFVVKIFFFNDCNRDSRIDLTRFNPAENFLAAVDDADNSVKDFEAEDFRIEYSWGTRGGSSIFSLHLFVYERDIPIARKETILF